MKTVNVRDFGAKGDGCTLDTVAIQNAIDSLEKGDTLEFSGKGIFLCGTLRLKGDMKLFIAPDTEICGSRNLEHYYANEFYHNEMVKTISLIYALDCDNIEICGGGKIQMNGDAFVNFDAWCPDETPRETMIKEYQEQTVVGPETKITRPSQPIFFNNCKNVHIHDIKVFNSPCWTITFSNSENILVEKIYVDNHNRIANNDGVHFTASKNIVVRDSIFLCGDDCFAATCITNENGVCENIEVYDCLMSSRSAAIRFGHLYSVVRNVVVRDIKILPSNRGISIFSGDGGLVENVKISNITCETRIHAGGWWGKGEGFVICSANKDGEIKNVEIENCTFIEENPSILAGKNGNLNGVKLTNCTFEYKKGSTHPYFEGKLDLQPNIEHITEAPFKAGDTLYVDGCRDVVVNGEVIA
ncbi:MAG: glycoside hydrolase [Clostridia bacterium]|nr:glycoside hydrolase [Clostridia bacterium]